MAQIRFYPHGDSGDVRDYLESLRENNQKWKAAVRLWTDIQILADFWPRTMNVTIRTLKGWEPLRELKRKYDKIAYRIFFFVKGNEIWLLSAFEKESQATPRKELERAYDRMKKVMEGKI